MNSTNTHRDPLEMALRAVPEVAPGTEAKFDSAGLLHLRRRMPASNRFLRWLFSGQWIRVQLDEQGTKMWQRIDGQRDLATMVIELEHEFGMDSQECQAAVVAFTKMLMLRHLILLRTNHPQSDSRS